MSKRLEVARKAKPSITYITKRTYKKGKKATTRVVKHTAEEMNEFVEGFSYSDPASGECDFIEVELNNQDNRWITTWMPKKGDKLTVHIDTTSWENVNKRVRITCGMFCVDNLGYSGSANKTCKIGATSIPETNSFHVTKRTKTWKNITIKELSKKIAERYHMGLKYDAEEHMIKELEQNKETDSTFLKELCEKYELGIKIYYGSIFIYSIEKYERKNSVVTYTEKNLGENWTYEDRLTGTYTGATIKLETTQEVEQEGKKKKKKKTTSTIKVGGGKRIYSCTETADTEAEARRIACAAVNKANAESCTLSFTIDADTRICSTRTIRIDGMGRMNGIYFVDNVDYSVTANGYFTMRVETHRVRNRIKK